MLDIMNKLLQFSKEGAFEVHPGITNWTELTGNVRYFYLLPRSQKKRHHCTSITACKRTYTGIYTYFCTVCKRTETSFVELLKTCLCLSLALRSTGRTGCHILARYVDMRKPSWRPGAAGTAGAAEVMEWAMKNEKATARFDVYAAVLSTIWRCDAVTLGKWCFTLRKTIMPSSVG